MFFTLVVTETTNKMLKQVEDLRNIKIIKRSGSATKLDGLHILCVPTYTSEYREHNLLD